VMICRFATCCPLQGSRSPFELPASRGHRARGSLTMTVRARSKSGSVCRLLPRENLAGRGTPSQLQTSSIKNCTSPIFPFPWSSTAVHYFASLGSFASFVTLLQPSSTRHCHLTFCTIRPPPKILMAESNGDAKTLKGRATTALRVPGLSIGFG
jgi:hypothetical protein